MTTQAIAPTTAQALADRGEAVLLDLRAPADFARGHPSGALSVPFSARGLAARVRVALRPGRPTLLVAADDASAEAAAAQLGEAGLDVLGVLAGGFPAWRASGLPQSEVGELTVDALSRLSPDTIVIDVRERLEWATGHVPGALLLPLGGLPAELPSIPRGRRVVAICEAGIRSCTAASILAAAGFSEVAHVPAGSSGYRKAGLPLEFPAADDAGTR